MTGRDIYWMMVRIQYGTSINSSNYENESGTVPWYDGLHVLVREYEQGAKLSSWYEYSYCTRTILRSSCSSEQQSVGQAIYYEYSYITGYDKTNVSRTKWCLMPDSNATSVELSSSNDATTTLRR